MISSEAQNELFTFKQFKIIQKSSSMKVGFDGVLLGAWTPLNNAVNILDIGAGTGLLTIMLAQRTKSSKIDAIEIDENAFLEASINVQNSKWAQRITVSHISLQNFVRGRRDVYDLVVCNPPFFSGGTLSGNSDRNAVRHTVKLPHNTLLQCVRDVMTEQGRFAVILPLIEGLRFIELAAHYRIFIHKIVEVKGQKGKKPERVLLYFAKVPVSEVEETELIIREAAEFTEEYRQLTASFYLDK